ncbi:hypothetical protein [Deefgea sp. CFH1-16]|uniref:hypothetical protein n=1 Tax=Deefgea sp. CFH1-16 TaxID=2675457 RepID=UPI0015F5351C|nr:hypothetical protein [Deefgea sp. CFH1-16]MBM5575416.1 hypothetical protein [Deefgea sp. CFH1-16]
MEKPDFNRIKKRFDLLYAFLIQLHELAKNQQWNDFEFAWPEYEKLTTDLPDINWFEFSAQEKQSLVDIMQKNSQLNSDLQLIAIAWQNEIQGKMKGLVQASRLSDKYL